MTTTHHGRLLHLWFLNGNGHSGFPAMTTSVLALAAKILNVAKQLLYETLLVSYLVAEVTTVVVQISCLCL